MVNNHRSVSENQNYREGRGVGTSVRGLKEGVCVSDAVLWPDIITEVGNVDAKMVEGVC